MQAFYLFSILMEFSSEVVHLMQHILKFIGIMSYTSVIFLWSPYLFLLLSNNNMRMLQIYFQLFSSFSEESLFEKSIFGFLGRPIVSVNSVSNSRL